MFYVPFPKPTVKDSPVTRFLDSLSVVGVEVAAIGTPEGLSGHSSLSVPKIEVKCLIFCLRVFSMYFGRYEVGGDKTVNGTANRYTFVKESSAEGP